MNFDLGLDRTTSVSLPIELSATWPAVLAFKNTGDARHLPKYMEAFFCAWSDTTGKYVWFDYRYSTSDPGPMGCANLHVVASVRVELDRKSKEGLEAAEKKAVELLWNEVFKKETYLEFRNKFLADVRQKAAPGEDPREKAFQSTIEVVDEHDFNKMLKGIGLR